MGKRRSFSRRIARKKQHLQQDERSLTPQPAELDHHNIAQMQGVIGNQAVQRAIAEGRLGAHEHFSGLPPVRGVAGEAVMREELEIQRQTIQERLNEAMDGWGTDEDAIMRITANATPAEKRAILNDPALVRRLASELSQGDMVQVLRNLDAPLAMRLNAAMDGWGTDEEAIQEILTNASPADRNAALADEALVNRLKSELSTAEMLTIFRAAGVPFKRIIELALEVWRASLDDIRSMIEAASDAECQTVWSDAAFMSRAEGILGADEYLNFVVTLRMFQPGATPEDHAAHTAASDADEAIQEHLSEYLTEAIREGRQIRGMVAVVDDADWDRAGIAHYGEDTWNNGKRDSINGFVDAQGRVWIHRNRGNAGTMIHEAMHKYSADHAVAEDISQPLNEGITEYFTRKVCEALDPPITGRGNYQSNYEVTQLLVGLVGEGIVARAYFDGETEALETAFVNQRSQEDWDNFVAHTRTNAWADAARIINEGGETE
jgi:hypothetical protein